VDNLPKVVTQLCPEYDLNPRPVDRKSSALPIAPPHYPTVEPPNNSIKDYKYYLLTSYLPTYLHLCDGAENLETLQRCRVIFLSFQFTYN